MAACKNRNIPNTVILGLSSLHRILWIFWWYLLLSCLGITAQSPEEVTQVFLNSHVVPDVLPSFHPSVSFRLSFLNTTLIPGQNLTKERINSQLRTRSDSILQSPPDGRRLQLAYLLP